MVSPIGSIEDDFPWKVLSRHANWGLEQNDCVIDSREWWEPKCYTE